MKIDELNPNHIITDEGKVFKRISDGLIYGREIHLGYTYYIGGVKLEEPLLELPEHFEEVINKDPYWELSDEEFTNKVSLGELVFDTDLSKWVEIINEDLNL